MAKFTSRIIFTFTFAVLFAGSAFAQAGHSVWSEKPLLIKEGDTGTTYKTFLKGTAVFAWVETTIRAYAHARGHISSTKYYEFILVKTTSSDADSISGLFNVRRNGALVCNKCVGKAYWLSPGGGPGNYFKIYVGTPSGFAEKWLYSGELTNRLDY
jgi:hypothetical protein